MAVRGWKIAGASIVLGLALTACSKEVAANDLEVGDCVEDEETLNSADVEAIDCGDDHVFELIGKFDVDDGDYPGATELTAEGDERCQGEIFEDYVGVPYEESAEVYVSPVPPSEETWNDADDRTILCFAHTLDLASTTGSVEGSGSGGEG
jgi:Septum formation